MGIDLDRFVDKDIDSGLLCLICFEVLDNPVMIDSCEHTYCNDCIVTWIHVNKTCPEDRITVNQKHLVSIPRFMKNQLNGLNLKCKFEAKGCKVVSTIESIESHEKECPFDEINTRETKIIENNSNELLFLKSEIKHKYKLEYQVLRYSLCEDMKKKAIKLTKTALHLCGRTNYGQIAAYIKTHLEPEHNKYWHCVAGSDFDCLITAVNYYFAIKIDGIYIIAFKTK